MRARCSVLAALIFTLGAVALAACSSGNASTDFPATTTTQRPKGSLSVNADVIPPVTIPPSGCPAATGTTVVITIDESGITPKCVTARLSQDLLFVNKGTAFHNVSIEDVTANLDVGDQQPFGRIGRYFMPGEYAIHSLTEPSVSINPTFHGTLVVTR